MFNKINYDFALELFMLFNQLLLLIMTIEIRQLFWEFLGQCMEFYINHGVPAAGRGFFIIENDIMVK